jgi:hypothetical protein
MVHRELLELRCLVRLSKTMALRIDHWRGRQPGIPTRAAAIRQLADERLDDIALKAEAGKC